jgi:hypothetical protein
LSTQTIAVFLSSNSTNFQSVFSTFQEVDLSNFIHSHFCSPSDGYLALESHITYPFNGSGIVFFNSLKSSKESIAKVISYLLSTTFCFMFIGILRSCSSFLSKRLSHASS